MACGSRLGDEHAWLRGALDEYIAEENGHEEWILDDIAPAAATPEAVRARARRRRRPS